MLKSYRSNTVELVDRLVISHKISFQALERMRDFAQLRAIYTIVGAVDGVVVPIHVRYADGGVSLKPTYTITIDSVNGPTINTVEE
jgi:hypothetical protein